MVSIEFISPYVIQTALVSAFHPIRDLLQEATETECDVEQRCPGIKGNLMLRGLSPGLLSGVNHSA
jgi:hypothetical protein